MTQIKYRIGFCMNDDRWQVHKEHLVRVAAPYAIKGGMDIPEFVVW